MTSSGQNYGHLIKDPSAFTALSGIHKRSVTECCFSPDTDQILTGSEDHTAVLWNLPSRDIELHDDTINDDHKLVCNRLQGNEAPVMSVSMHKRLIVSAAQDGRVKLWRCAPDHEIISAPTSISSSRHQQSMIGSQSHLSQKSRYKQPDRDSVSYTCHTSRIESVAFANDARSFATGSDDKSVKIWSTECRNKMLVSLLDGHTNWVKCVRWSKTSNSLLASCGDDGKICIWDTRTRIRQPPCEVIASRRRMQFNCLDWHPVFDHHLATGAQDASCVIWDLRNRRQVQVYAEHDGSVNSVAFNWGGSLLLTGSSDKTSKIFDVCEGRHMFKLMSHNAPVTSVCFSASDELFATASKDKNVIIWKRNFDTVNIILEDESVRDDTVIDDNDDSSNYFTESDNLASTTGYRVPANRQRYSRHQYCNK